MFIMSPQNHLINEVKYKCSVKALQHGVILRNIEIFFDVVFGWCLIRTNNLTQTFQASQCKVPSVH